jgi:hypothetical protein
MWVGVRKELAHYLECGTHNLLEVHTQRYGWMCFYKILYTHYCEDSRTLLPNLVLNTLILL